MRVVVTGGAGFFGTWIVKHLLDLHHEVIVVDATVFTKRWELIMSPEEIARVRWVVCSVSEPAFIATLTELGPDAVVHLAGLQIPTCRDNPVLGAHVNLVGTLNVFEAAKARKAAGHKPFSIVYASSAAIFGPDEDYHREAVNDSSAPMPASHYGAFKLCCEHSARAYFTANGISSVGLRPLSVYGPGRDAGLTSFPSRSIAAAVRGEPFEIPFSGPTCYVHVREIADIFVKCAQHAVEGSHVYTIGGDTVDVAGFVATLDKELPGASKLITISGGTIPIASKIDDAALRADVPSLIRIPLAAGIAETVLVFQRLHAEGRLVA